MLVKIFHGTKPADIPVEQPSVCRAPMSLRRNFRDSPVLVGISFSDVGDR